MPSMIALLGLAATAAYQNRDKISEMLGGMGSQAAGAPNAADAPSSQGGLLASLGGLLGGAGLGGAGGAGAGGAAIGSMLCGGLSDLVQHFQQNGHGAAAASWVGSGPNQAIGADQLAQALGPDTLNTLQQHTGLSRDDLLSRLSTQLPDMVNKFTPDGRLPTEAECARLS
jgi:uncharacterized protein YidB (DUF937 family)